MAVFETVRSRQYLAGLSQRVIGCAIEVHRHLGPGLLESVYRRCLARFGFRADLMVEGKVLVELKAVDRLTPVHEAQLLTYLKLSGLRLGLLLNFNAVPLKNGIRRLVR